jgi:hypothetical protein
MKYVIKAQSGISGTCNLGEGNSAPAAWEDAFGRKPWTDSTKRAARRAWCETVQSDEPVSYSGH